MTFQCVFRVTVPVWKADEQKCLSGERCPWELGELPVEKMLVWTLGTSRFCFVGSREKSGKSTKTLWLSLWKTLAVP